MLGAVLQADIEELIRDRQWDLLRDAIGQLDPADVAELIIDLPPDDEAIVFRVLPRNMAARVFAHLPVEHQEELIGSLSGEHTRAIVEQMTPDDRTRLLEELPAEVARRLLEALPPAESRTARELLGYAPSSAGRYMTTRYVALRPEMSAAEALAHVRLTGRGQETLNALFIVDADGMLLEDVRLSTLVMADPATRISDIHDRPSHVIAASTDREDVVQAFAKYDRYVLPVVDSQRRMLGIITVDDVLDVATEEATEDIHKLGAVETLDAPYLDVSMFQMLRKRGGWLSVLFLGEMLTATAMGYFEHEIAKAVVLAMFVPLIISSGGNSGAQAATLVIRSLALTELRLQDWWRVLWRELSSGLVLGGWLGLIGAVRVFVWQRAGWIDYGPHYALVALTVWLSLVGVVAFGTLAGSMMPFLLRRVGFDPATSSAPFVATLVDVSGLLIYFSIAAVILRGALL